jgi:quinolinate synthase
MLKLYHGTENAKCMNNLVKKKFMSLRKNYPEITIIAHPECPPDVISASDFAGSTSHMVNYVKEKKPKNVFLVTECSMSDNVQIENPDVNFIKTCNLCPHMKSIRTLSNILRLLSKIRKMKY